MDEQQRHHFVNEVWQRFEAVQNWAIANWPDSEHPLSTSDFVEARKEILALGQAHAHRPLSAEAEPEQGGAQYVDVTPAPWP